MFYIKKSHRKMKCTKLLREILISFYYNTERIRFEDTLPNVKLSIILIRTLERSLLAWNFKMEVMLKSILRHDPELGASKISQQIVLSRTVIQLTNISGLCFC